MLSESAGFVFYCGLKYWKNELTGRNEFAYTLLPGADGYMDLQDCHSIVVTARELPDLIRGGSVDSTGRMA
jgi:hypothetical protein